MLYINTVHEKNNCNESNLPSTFISSLLRYFAIIPVHQKWQNVL